jgi:hypothetical protein
VIRLNLVPSRLKQVTTRGRLRLIVIITIPIPIPVLLLLLFLLLLVLLRWLLTIVARVV